jgi:hypothetical protein
MHFGDCFLIMVYMLEFGIKNSKFCVGNLLNDTVLPQEILNERNLNLTKEKSLIALHLTKF